MFQDKVFLLRLIAISPIHIGCDDVYEPTTFRIDEQMRELIHFKPHDFVDRLNENQKKTFSDLCSKGTLESLVEIFKFVGAVPTPGNSIALCPGFVEHYRELKNLTPRAIGNEMKKFTIHRVAYSPYSQQPYVPGSSLKGTVRTAYLNQLAKESKIGRQPRDAKHLEEMLLGGSFERDPLRYLHISDFQPKATSRRIVYAVNKKKKASKYEARGPFQILETIEPQSEFEGTMKLSGMQQDPVSPLEPQRFLDALRAFYLPMFREEAKTLDAVSVNMRLVKAAIQKIRQNKKDGEVSCLIRIGRHSGAEAGTIEGYRKIKIMQGQGKPARYGDGATTVWLSSDERKPKDCKDLLPFGWAILKIVKAH